MSAFLPTRSDEYPYLPGDEGTLVIPNGRLDGLLVKVLRLNGGRMMIVEVLSLTPKVADSWNIGDPMCIVFDEFKLNPEPRHGH